MKSICIIWEFRAKPGLEVEFEEAYGPDGEWVRLFRRAEGYLGTELLRDADKARQYLSIDRWVSEAAYNAFRKQYAEAYAAVDRLCERLTQREVPRGTWLVL